MQGGLTAAGGEGSRQPDFLGDRGKFFVNVLLVFDDGRLLCGHVFQQVGESRVVRAHFALRMDGHENGCGEPNRAKSGNQERFEVHSSDYSHFRAQYPEFCKISAIGRNTACLTANPR